VANIGGRTLCDGWMKTRFGLGNIAVGFFLATRIFKPRPSASWTSIKEYGNAKHWEPMITLFQPMKKTSIQARLRLHPTMPTQPRQTMRVEFEYDGAARWLTWLLGTCAEPKCLAVANPRPASTLLTGW